MGLPGNEGITIGLGLLGKLKEGVSKRPEKDRAPPRRGN